MKYSCCFLPNLTAIMCVRLFCPQAKNISSYKHYKSCFICLLTLDNIWLWKSAKSTYASEMTNDFTLACVIVIVREGKCLRTLTFAT